MLYKVVPICMACQAKVPRAAVFCEDENARVIVTCHVCLEIQAGMLKAAGMYVHHGRWWRQPAFEASSIAVDFRFTGHISLYALAFFYVATRPGFDQAYEINELNHFFRWKCRGFEL